MTAAQLGSQTRPTEPAPSATERASLFVEVKTIQSRFAGAWCALCLLGGCRDRPQPHATGDASSASAPARAASAPMPAASAPELGSGRTTASTVPVRPRIHARKTGRFVVVDQRDRAWAKSCLIHRACTIEARPLEPCKPGQTARAWASLGLERDDLDGKHVELRGRLQLDDGYFSTAVACGPSTCCNGVRRQAVLDDPPNALGLDAPLCKGDESRLCCNALVNGQAVLVSGQLDNMQPTRSTSPNAAMPSMPWQLTDVSICQLAEPREEHPPSKPADKRSSGP